MTITEVNRFTFHEWRTRVVNLLRRNAFRSLHTRYINDEISYSDYKQLVCDLVNYVREKMGDPPFSYDTFDKGWQFHNISAYHYEIAFHGVVNVIFGWW